jgi:hypothetical protein
MKATVPPTILEGMPQRAVKRLKSRLLPHRQGQVEEALSRCRRGAFVRGGHLPDGAVRLSDLELASGAGTSQENDPSGDCRERCSKRKSMLFADLATMGHGPPGPAQRRFTHQDFDRENKRGAGTGSNKD